MTHSQTNPSKIAILGGGISGLSLAWFLKKKFEEKINISIFEARQKLGGWIQTEQIDQFLFETGPRSLRGSKETLELCRELSLELIEADPSSKKRFLYIDKRLQEIPSSLVSFALNPLTRKVFFALLKESFISKGDLEEESIAAFFDRRLGENIRKRFVDPFISGIYAGDAELLSMPSCLPSLWQDEKKFGSLVKAALSRIFEKKAEGIFSLKQGLGNLIASLESRLSARICLNTPIQRIEFLQANAKLHFKNGNTEIFDRIFSTISASSLASLIDPSLNIFSLLKKSRSAGIATVNLGFDRSVLNKAGFGYLIPKTEGESILGTVFDSQVFPQQNKAKNETRMTVMLGGARNPDLLNLSDLQLENLARQAIAKHLGIFQKPKALLIRRHINAIAQYHLGHHAWLTDLQKELKKIPLLSLIGNSYYGVSVNDCVKMAKKLADESIF